MKYCQFCGQEIKDGVICSCSESAKRNKILENKIKWAILAGAAAIAIILVVVICLACFNGTEKPYNAPSNPSTNNSETNPDTAGGDDSTNNNEISSKKIDPFDYMDAPIIDGANKEATFFISLDNDSLAQDLAGLEPASDTQEAWDQWRSSYFQYLEYSEIISVTCSKTTNLENGDVIIVEISIPEVLCDKVKNATKTYSISGLIDMETYDFFDDITVVFEGMSGDALARIEKKRVSDILNDCNFNLSTSYSLSNNDIITISITNAEYLKSKYSVVPEKLSKTYTVSGLSSYATSASRLPIEDIERFAKRYYEECFENLQSDDTYTYENIKYEGTYFYVSNGSGYSWNRPYENFIEIIISYDHYVYDVPMGNTTTTLCFTDVIFDSSGIVFLSYEEGVESIIVDYDCYDKTFLAITVTAD